MSNREKFKIVTPEFSGSFVNLAKARKFGEGEPKYGLTIVVPKEDPFWKEVADKTEACAIDKWGKIPEGLYTTVKDGDQPQGRKKVMRKEWAGCYAVLASSTSKVDVVDLQGNDVIDGSKLYSGAIYRAVVRVGWWSHPQNGDGVSVFLDNVLRVGDGKQITGRASPQDDFADFIEKSESGNPLEN